MSNSQKWIRDELRAALASGYTVEKAMDALIYNMGQRTQDVIAVVQDEHAALLRQAHDPLRPGLTDEQAVRMTEYVKVLTAAVGWTTSAAMNL